MDRLEFRKEIRAHFLRKLSRFFPMDRLDPTIIFMNTRDADKIDIRRMSTEDRALRERNNNITWEHSLRGMGTLCQCEICRPPQLAPLTSPAQEVPLCQLEMNL
jgi:hypothetical protein